MIKFLIGIACKIWVVFTAIMYICKYGIHGAHRKTYDDYKKILQIYNKARMEYFNRIGKSWKPQKQNTAKSYSFLKWEYTKRSYPINSWELKRWFGLGRTIATVYSDNSWYVWDKHGVCVGVSRESSIATSKKAAETHIINNEGLVL